MKRVLLFTIAVLVATASQPGLVQAQEVDNHAAVQSLLNVRAQAVKDHNKQLFMNTVDPQASEAFKSAQSLSFDGLSSMPFSKYELVAREDDSGDLSHGLSIAGMRNADNAYMSETRQVYRYADYDDRDAFNSQWISYVKRGGKWFAASDTDAEVIGLTSDRELWDDGPMVAQKTEHFLVLTRPNQTARGAALANLAEGGMTVFSSRWTQQWSQRLPILVPGSPAELAKVLRTTADVSNFAAFVVYTPYRDNGWKTTAPRMYAQDANLAGNSIQRQTQTVVHELTHAASSDLSGPFTPSWQHEGMAEWMRLNKPIQFAAPAGVKVELPSSSDFATASADKLHNAYALSTSATAFLSKSEGIDAPIDLFMSVGVRRSEPGSPSYNINQAFQAVTGRSVDQFTKSWQGG